MKNRSNLSLYTLLTILGVVVYSNLFAVEDFFFIENQNVLQNKSDSLSEKIEAPDFTFQTIEGQNATLSDLHGKLVILDFMSTTCVTCQASIEDLVELESKIEADVVIISISVYPAYDTVQVLLDWKEEWDSNWTYVRDTDIPPISQLYVVKAIPTYVVVNESGYIVYRQIGGTVELLVENLQLVID